MKQLIIIFLAISAIMISLATMQFIVIMDNNKKINQFYNRIDECIIHIEK